MMNFLEKIKKVYSNYCNKKQMFAKIIKTLKI